MSSGVAGPLGEGARVRTSEHLNHWRDLAEMLGSEALKESDTYVVYREDVPEGVTLAEALVHGIDS